MWMMVIPALIALWKSSSFVPEPPWSVKEGPLALGHANHDGHAQLMGGCRHRLQRDEVRKVEVPDGDVGPFGGFQDFPQGVHGVAS